MLETLVYAPQIFMKFFFREFTERTLSVFTVWRSVTRSSHRTSYFLFFIFATSLKLCDQIILFVPFFYGHFLINKNNNTVLSFEQTRLPSHWTALTRCPRSLCHSVQLTRPTCAVSREPCHHLFRQRHLSVLHTITAAMSSWANTYFGDQLVTKSGLQSTSEVLKGKKYVGIYFRYNLSSASIAPELLS